MAELTVYGVTRTGKTQVFSSIQELTYQSDRYTPADSLQLTVLDPIVEQVVSVTAKNRERTFFQGIVDEQRTVRGSGGNYTSLCCRSRCGAWMLDNEARPQSAAFVTAAQIFAEQAMPFGVEGHRLPENVMLQDFVISKGSSRWDVISLFCRRAFGKAPYLDRENYLSLSPYGGKKVVFSSCRADATPYQKLELWEDRTRLISLLHVQTGKGQDQSAYYGGRISNALAESLGIRRERYYHPAKEWGTQLQQSARAMLQDRHQDFWSAQLTLPGLPDLCIGDQGEIWERDLVRTGLFVSQVQVQLSRQGLQTRIRLSDLETPV